MAGVVGQKNDGGIKKLSESGELKSKMEDVGKEWKRCWRIVKDESGPGQDKRDWKCTGLIENGLIENELSWMKVEAMGKPDWKAKKNEAGKESE